MAVGLTYAIFLLVYVLGVAGPMKLAVQQTIQLAKNFPEISGKLHSLFTDTLANFSRMLTEDQYTKVAALLTEKTQEYGQKFLEKSVTSIDDITAWLLYLFLVPILVLFFLKDKSQLQSSFTRLIPKERELVDRVWKETEGKIANYIRGKVWEILLVGFASWIAYYLLGFKYTAIMGLISGLSVIIPFAGVFGAAVPLIILGYVQWGFTWELGRLMIAFGVIQGVDGYIVVPYIFSEAVKLHPLFILMAIFIFGSIWGIWGVFFAIPLATLAKSLLNALLDSLENPA